MNSPASHSHARPDTPMSVAADQDSATVTAHLAVSTKSLAKMLDISARSLDRADAAGLIPSPIYVGGAKRFRIDGPTGIKAWLAAGCPRREQFEGGHMKLSEAQ